MYCLHMGATGPRATTDPVYKLLNKLSKKNLYKTIWRIKFPTYLTNQPALYPITYTHDLMWPKQLVI